MNMQRPIGNGGHFEQEAGPVVTLPRSGLGGGAIALGSIASAAILFLVLNQQRLAREEPAGPRQQAAQISAPPALALPPTAPAGAPAMLVPMPPLSPPLQSPTALAPVSPVQAQSRSLTGRQLHPVVMEPWPPAEAASASTPPFSGQPNWVPPPVPSPAPAFNGPAIVHDNGESRDWSGTSPTLGRSPEQAAPTGTGSPASSRASPRPIGDLSQVVAVGTMIEAVLETPVDSSRPGMTRAIVSRPVRSFDGSRVLIPRGARLVGDMGGEAQGGNRLLIKWAQVILPNGVALEINSPGADASGQAGLDAISHGGFGRFIGGVLQTAVTVGAAAVGARGAPVYYAVPVAGSAAQMVPTGSGGRRLTVAAGAQINVVVARTLDFSSSDAR